MKGRYHHNPCLSEAHRKLWPAPPRHGSVYEWCYVSGRISVLEDGLLGRELFMRILSSHGVEELSRIIGDSPVRGYFAHQADLSEWERQINLYCLERLTDIKRFSPLPLVCELFQLPYDFLNLKNYIKEKVLGIPYEAHVLGRILKDEWDLLWNERQTDLPETFVKTVILLKERLAGGGEASGIIDSIVDNASLCSLREAAEQVGSPLIENWVRQYRLVKGVEIVWRTLLSGGARDRGLTVLVRGAMDSDILVELACSPMEEWPRICVNIFPPGVVERLFRGSPREGVREYRKVTDDYLLHEIKPAKNVTFGPERVFGYCVGLTRELFNLKLTVGGMVNRVSPALLAGLLRETYAEI